MNDLVFLEPNSIKPISLDELMKSPQSEMEWLRKEEPVLYDYFINNKLELYCSNSEIRVMSEDFDLSFEVFSKLTISMMKRSPTIKIIK